MPDINPLLKESFDLNKELDSENIYSWETYIKDIITEMDLDCERLSSCTTKTNIFSIKSYVKDKSLNYYTNLNYVKLSNLNNQNKIFLYKSLKSDFEKEFYLTYSNFETRKLISKFRISDHSLEIETGRYKKIPRVQRICQFCDNNNLDDEAHFFFTCELNKQLRNSLFFDFDIPLNNNHSILANDPNRSQLYPETLKTILNPRNYRQIQSLGSFIKQSLELRTGGS